MYKKYVEDVEYSAQVKAEYTNGPFAKDDANRKRIIKRHGCDAAALPRGEGWTIRRAAQASGDEQPSRIHGK